MKLGIYGDSFAIGSIQTLNTHWYHVLAKMLGGEYHTYGMGATSLYYSYNNFVREYKNYDINIFLVTNYGRYTKSIVLEGDDEDRNHWASSINWVEHTLKTFPNLTSKDLRFLEMLRSWFIVSDDDYSQLCQRLMIEDVCRICPNVIIIPCFADNLSIHQDYKKQLGISEKGSCWDFLLAQGEWFDNLDYATVDERYEVISCHFTPETNRAFAESVFNFITTGKPIERPAVIPHNNTLEYYYKKRS